MIGARWVEVWNVAAGAWATAMLRACVSGGAFIGGVWLFIRLMPRLSPAVRCWLWWLACAKLLLAMLSLPAIALPLLRAPWTSPPERRATAVRTAPAEPTRVTSPRRSPSQLDPDPPHPAPAPAAILFAIWGVCIGCSAYIAARQARTARRLYRRARTAPATLTHELNALCDRLGLRRPPRLLESSEVSSPVLLGLFRPAILVPPDGQLRLGRQELQMVLAHELAHLRRNDLWLALLPRLTRALFFFFPPAWLAIREWALCREAACDAVALRTCDGAPAEYGQLLLRLVSQSTLPDGALAFGRRSGARLLERRLRMLTPHRRLPLALTVMIALTAATGMLPLHLVSAAPPSVRALHTAETSSVATLPLPLGGAPVQARVSHDSQSPAVAPAPPARLAKSPIIDRRALSLKAPPILLAAETAPLRVAFAGDPKVSDPPTTRSPAFTENPDAADADTKPRVRSATISAISVEGLDQISKAVVLEAITERPGAEYSPLTAEKDRMAVEKLGWFRRVQIVTAPDHGTMRVTFRVTEYPTVRELVVSGSSFLDPMRIPELLLTRTSQPFNRTHWEADLRTISRLYQEAGYQVTMGANLESDAFQREGRLTLQLNEVRIGSLRFRWLDGNGKEDRNANADAQKAVAERLGKLLQQQTGALYNSRKLQSDFQSLRNTGEFANISPVVEVGQRLSVTITWVLSPKTKE